MDIKIGDIMLIDGRSQLNASGRIIRTIENNGIYPLNEFCPNHINIVLEPTDEIRDVKVIGAFPSGSKITNIGWWMDNKDTNFCIRTFNDFIASYQRQVMESWMYHYYQKQIPYDSLSCIGILLKYLVLTKVTNKILNLIIKYLWNDNLQKRVYLNCAELAYLIYMSIGKIPISFYPNYIMPSDFYRSKEWRTVYRHYNYDYPRL